MRRAGLFASSVLHRAGRQHQEQKPQQQESDSPLDETRSRELEVEALERGFMRRDTPDSKVYMETHLTRPECISGGVPVCNLPPVEREKTEFDVYQRSTRDFTSQVTPYGTTGVGLGAGFGAKEDKRLGFLRPRKLQPFGGESSIVPKYDENGMPIDPTLRKDQLMKKRLEYMKSFEGTTMSHREHFLLVDLDFEKDAMLFGNTRGEFERNVTKLKQVISTYTAWERTDNFYYYGTFVLKALTAWVLMECLQQYYELKLLAGHYDDFVEATEATLDGLEADFHRDLHRAREELQSHKPDFRPIVEAVRREKRRLLDAKTAQITEQKVVERNNSDSSNSNNDNNNSNRNNNKIVSDSNNNESTEKDLTIALGEALGAHNSGNERQLYHQQHGQQEKQHHQQENLSGNGSHSVVYHPMDTTNEQGYLASLQQREMQHEMKRLHDTATASKTGSYSMVAAIWRKIRGVEGEDAAVLTPLQQEDFARLSYAASPTSIDTLRSIRRILLPRSEDYIQVVREEMLEYRREKEAKILHPD
ncbi:uncharacterized protein TM35_000232540 [Trypanosoma theileri]|uniref:Uncharacterized protein n=1 Tax=Trypanosoma theileri TaxID=67003 RepID=A0A1X0NS34_9TRYP|nr:uncharacterized protein TM35_000232540 [Trypanosoma theileri]ORC87283.1 hypothetical protein TM35_000232540 [Trypanosoma theileri]